ncbi:MAG: N-formylglutamate amidohydrolase [Verrucomicrobiaceae bacterium]|nr:N-formylglutamate amidohydrolase [Verrucomicrobiaceae bacterium]
MFAHRFPLLLFPLLALAFSPVSAKEKEDKAPAGQGPYIEYIPGTLPLVISAPHGGYLKPGDIPDRIGGKVEQDSFTQEMARAIREEFQKRTGGTPYVILCRLHRVKLDCNREIKEAAQGNPTAEKSWRDYHAFIEKAKAEVEQKFGAGLYIDLHGQRHEQGRIELGYLLSGQELALDDDAITKQAGKTSVRELDQRSPASFVDLLRGEVSLGALLDAKGYTCVPGPTVHAPAEGELYFPGGYDTQIHGSRDGGTLSGIQMECPFVGVRDTKPHRENFAKAFCEVLTTQYFPAHFGKPLGPQKAP